MIFWFMNSILMEIQYLEIKADMFSDVFYQTSMISVHSKKKPASLFWRSVYICALHILFSTKKKKKHIYFLMVSTVVAAASKVKMRNYKTS